MAQTRSKCKWRLAACLLAASPLLICAGASASQVQHSPNESNAIPSGNQFTITHQVIAAGGISRARNDCFDLAGTMGQPVVGRSQAASFVIDSGFWANSLSRDSLFRSSFEGCQP